MHEIAETYRRRWFAYCRSLGLDEEAQRAIADEVIPNVTPGKFDRDGQVSRKSLFSNSRLFNQAMVELIRIEGCV